VWFFCDGQSTCIHWKHDISSLSMKTSLTIILIMSLSFALVSCAHKDRIQPGNTALVKDRISLPSKQPDEAALREYIENILVEKGLDRSKVQGLFSDPRVTIDPRFIVKHLFTTTPITSTAPVTDPTYYSPRFIPLGRIFIEENREIFDCIKEKYGISPEIITAILIIESKLGTLTEEYKAFHVYTNLTLADSQDVLSLLKETEGTNYPGLYQEPLIKKAQKRGRWAAGELYHLILLSDKLNYDPIELKSSCAGALGPGQFIPSTFTGFGVDGDSDGRIDPFSMPDAMASIANYLKKSGWNDAGPEQKQRTAIWLYNHSETYVQTILKLYRELETAGITTAGS
jgi:membrane-bound lytic murein transglycosylase B